MKFKSKLPDVGTTIFTVMSQMAADHSAINLGQGYPDFNASPQLLELVTKAMREGHNQYPPMPGIKPLREQIAHKVSRLYGHSYDPDTEITVTSGATEALMASIQAFVTPGDEVIVIEPCYDLYIPAIRLAGGLPVVVPMTAPTADHPHYRVDWQRVRAAITARTRLLMLNFPHNPTGIILTSDDLDELEKIVSDTGVMLLSDEAYEHIVFDGRKHQSLTSRQSLAANTIAIFSFGKTYHVTGWKVGYVCTPPALTTEVRKVHQFMVFTTTSPMQFALANYMKDPEPYESLSAFYQEKRDLLASGLENSRFNVLPSQGTFFLLAEYKTISDKTELEFAQWLTATHGVAAIPVSAFYAHPDSPQSNHQIVRFCFAKQNPTLEAAARKLQAV
jgi:methionine aminotransferase